MWDYGANTWKIYNTTLQTMLEQAQKQLLELRYVFIRITTKENKKEHCFYRKRVQEINYNRKNEQSQAGAKLDVLEQT